LGIAESMVSASDGGIYTLERLQAALQRREGELRAARKAGRRSHAQRTALARELAIHAAELDNMQVKRTSYIAFDVCVLFVRNAQSLQHQYDALLQMYGEKEEQLQELRLDLQDVKDMYKMQLDEILMLKRQVQKSQMK
jgi:TATA element modulatory factor